MPGDPVKDQKIIRGKAGAFEERIKDLFCKEEMQVFEQRPCSRTLLIKAISDVV
jgi:hypothetical protein